MTLLAEAASYLAPFENASCGVDGGFRGARELREKLIAASATPERILLEEILAELTRARTKFPGDNVTMLALMEEVGELAKATFEESRARVRKEAIQVACMAMRVVLDGDATLDEWRYGKSLDALVERK